MQSTCVECDDTGFVVAEAGGTSAGRRCACSRRQPGNADLLAAGLPRRHLHCTFESYRPQNTHQSRALETARAFADEFPATRRGLLFTGPCGTGKTHLAAAILRQVVLEQGAEAIFADYQDLLKRVQATFSRSSGEGPSEESVLAPVLSAELLVLDDLGASRSTPWSEETMSRLLSVRYNAELTTILTTNLLDLDADPADRAHVPKDVNLLQDRMLEPVLSRIHEMCQVVHLEGPDHRRTQRA